MDIRLPSICHVSSALRHVTIQRPKEKRTNRQVTNIFVYQSWWPAVLIRYVPLCEGRRGHDRMVVGFMQSMSITTNVVSLNPAQARCTRYNIM
jgi:hypothetical protein